MPDRRRPEGFLKLVQQPASSPLYVVKRVVVWRASVSTTASFCFALVNGRNPSIHPKTHLPVQAAATLKPVQYARRKYKVERVRESTSGWLLRNTANALGILARNFSTHHYLNTIIHPDFASPCMQRVERRSTTALLLTTCAECRQNHLYKMAGCLGYQ